MFQRILEWLRGVLDKMINSSSVKSTFNVNVALSPYMVNALAMWTEMYAGRAYWLNQSQEGASIRGEAVRKMRSLNLPSAIASEIARLVTIEMGVQITGSARADFLNAQMQVIVGKLRQQVEYCAAKGGLVLKPYISDDGTIAVDFIQADQFYPIAYDSNGHISSAVFSDQRRFGNDWVTRLEYHDMNKAESSCRIVNAAFRSHSQSDLGIKVSLNIIPDWAQIEPEAMITGIDRPLFAYFRYPMANHIDPSSPLGVSCYSKGIELIENADTQWSDLMWEFESGKRALYVDELAFQKDPQTKLPALPNKRLYRTLATNATDKNFFEDWTPTFREQSILNGLNAILQKIEFVCSLATGTLSNPEEIERTATEIKIGKQRTYVMVTDTQKNLKDALEHLLYAMDTWATIGGLVEQGDYQAVYNFSDSVVEDKDLQQSQDLQAVSAGIMSKVEFRMRNYGETEEVAKAKVAEVQKEGSGLLGGLLDNLVNNQNNNTAINNEQPASVG